MRQPLLGGERTTVCQQPSQAELPGGGGWLLVARVGWVVLTLLLLALTIIAIPRADALFQTICPSLALAPHTDRPALTIAMGSPASLGQDTSPRYSTGKPRTPAIA